MIRRIARATVVAIAALSMTACATTTIRVPSPTADQGSTAASTAGATDQSTRSAASVQEDACLGFFSRPTYDSSLLYRSLAAAGDEQTSSINRDVADQIRELGSDPALPEETRDQLEVLARGSMLEADRAEMSRALTAFAVTCAQGGLKTAAWAMNADADGTKPASMSCADLLTRPQTLEPFGNANVLPSNMFALVGQGPRYVDRLDLARKVSDQLGAETAQAADPKIRKLASQLRQPLIDALDGDRESPGIRVPLAELTEYCSHLRS